LSSTSRPLRIELAASRALATSLMAIGAMGAAGLGLTDMPPVLALVLAVPVVAWSFVLASREWRRPTVSLVLAGDGRVRVDGVLVDAFRLEWQGVLAVLQWRTADRRHRRVAWPDVLDAAARRELRLWSLGRAVRASTAAVAP
jgi:toxin CptA